MPLNQISDSNTEGLSDDGNIRNIMLFKLMLMKSFWYEKKFFSNFFFFGDYIWLYFTIYMLKSDYQK